VAFPALSGPRVVAGQQGETATRQLGDRAEVTFVERQQPPRPETMGKNHHRKVSQPKIKSGILLIQPGHRAMLIRGQSLNTEPPCRHVAQERPGSKRAPTSADEIARLRGHRRRHDQVAAFCAHQITDRAMEPVTRIPESDQRRGVNDQGHPPSPASGAASARAAFAPGRSTAGHPGRALRSGQPPTTYAARRYPRARQLLDD
jgi:hypothetical protein